MERSYHPNGRGIGEICIPTNATPPKILVLRLYIRRSDTGSGIGKAFVLHTMPRPKTENVKVQNLERDLARRALVREAPEASQGPKGPIWRVFSKMETFGNKTPTAVI